MLLSSPARGHHQVSPRQAGVPQVIKTFSITLGVLLLVACSSSSSSSTPDSGFVVPDGGLAPPDSGIVAPDAKFRSDARIVQPVDGAFSMDSAGLGKTVCNSLVNVASPVTVTVTGGTAPVGTGGTVANGTYTVTSAMVIDGDLVDAGLPASMARTTFSISASTIGTVTTSSGQTTTAEATFATVGRNFTLTPTCPAGGMVETGTYTATATTLTLLEQTSVGHSMATSVTTLTMQ